MRLVDSAMDPVYDATVFVVHVYSWEDLEWNAKHADMMRIDEDNKSRIDFTKFNCVDELNPVLQAPLVNCVMPSQMHEQETRMQLICGK